MKIVKELKQRLVGLLTTPSEEMGLWARFVQTQTRLWWLCGRQLRRNNALAMSAALSFRTIFALVPIVVLGFLMLKGMGFIDEKKQLLDNALHELRLDQMMATTRTEAPRRAQAATDMMAMQLAAAQGGPMNMAVLQWATLQAVASHGAEQTITVADKLTELIQKVEDRMTVGALGPIGVALLIWTALTLLTTVERSLNRIFEAPRTRSLARRILLYWSVLTLAPLMLLVVSYATEEAGRAAEGAPKVWWLVESVGWAGMLIVGIAVLAFVYQLTPNTRVSLRSAAMGAALAFPLWLIARWGMAVYVKRVAGGSVYGAMGLIPLFLMWLNVSWWVFLFGAQLAYSTAHLGRAPSLRPRDGDVAGPWELLAAMVALARQNADHKRPVPAADVADALSISADNASSLLKRLASAGFISRTAEDDPRSYLPAMPPEAIQAADVLRVDCAYAREAGWPGEPAVGRSVHQVVRRSEAGIENLTVADIIRA